MESNLKTYFARWFESTIQIVRTYGEGEEKSVKEQYAVDAVSFTDCEAKLTSEFSPEAVLAEKVAQYSEIIVSDDEDDAWWYRVKIDTVTVDERTSKEKHSKMSYLVNASSVNKARAYTDKVLGESMLDYTISDINKTKIIGIIHHHEQ